MYAGQLKTNLRNLIPPRPPTVPKPPLVEMKEKNNIININTLSAPDIAPRFPLCEPEEEIEAPRSILEVKPIRTNPGRVQVPNSLKEKYKQKIRKKFNMAKGPVTAVTPGTQVLTPPKQIARGVDPRKVSEA